MGKAVTDVLAREGCQAVLVTQDLNKLVQHRARQEARRIEADMASADGASSAFERCVALTGQAPDAFVNCAGTVFLTVLILYYALVAVQPQPAGQAQADRFLAVDPVIKRGRRSVAQVLKVLIEQMREQLQNVE